MPPNLAAYPFSTQLKTTLFAPVLQGGGFNGSRRGETSRKKANRQRKCCASDSKRI
jgi:hypothetical protein